MPSSAKVTGLGFFGRSGTVGVGETQALADKAVQVGSRDLVLRVVGLNIPHAEVKFPNRDPTGAGHSLKMRGSQPLVPHRPT
jgi:hypothetical protein